MNIQPTGVVLGPSSYPQQTPVSGSSTSYDAGRRAPPEPRAHPVEARRPGEIARAAACLLYDVSAEDIQRVKSFVSGGRFARVQVVMKGTRNLAALVSLVDYGPAWSRKMERAMCAELERGSRDWLGSNAVWRWTTDMGPGHGEEMLSCSVDDVLNAFGDVASLYTGAESIVHGAVVCLAKRASRGLLPVVFSHGNEPWSFFSVPIERSKLYIHSDMPAEIRDPTVFRRVMRTLVRLSRRVADTLRNPETRALVVAVTTALARRL